MIPNITGIWNGSYVENAKLGYAVTFSQIGSGLISLIGDSETPSIYEGGFVLDILTQSDPFENYGLNPTSPLPE